METWSISRRMLARATRQRLRCLLQADARTQFAMQSGRATEPLSHVSPADRPYLHLGSGVSVAAGVVTNEHVVSGFSRVDLFTSDGRRFGATVLSTDPTRDLALLAPDLPFPQLTWNQLANSDKGTS